MTKKILLVALLSIASTALQVNWAVPGATSAMDLAGASFFSIEWLCVYPAVLVMILLALLERRGARLLLESLSCTGLLAACWLALNYLEFNSRVASWSTYSAAEIWRHVLPASAVTIAICGAFFFIFSYAILRLHARRR